MMESMWSHYVGGVDLQEQLRNELRPAIPPNWEEETYPHISIHPGFKIPESVTEDAACMLETIGNSLVGERIPVRDVYCHNTLTSTDPTFVIAIELDVTLSHIRRLQHAYITNYGGEIEYEPQRPHLTLFRESDDTDTHKHLTTQQHTDIKQHITNLPELPDTIRITELNVETH